MARITIGLGDTQTIDQSGTDTVSFLGAGTLNIAGTPQAPITVTLSQVAGVGLLDTINISNASVTLDGVAGVSALTTYNIGAGGTLTLANTLGVGALSSIAFTGQNSRLVLASGLNLNVLSGAISGFAPGSSIDVNALASSVTYADDSGSGTGGTLTLLNSGGGAVGTLTLRTGEYVAGDFRLTPDGSGGTIVDFGIGVTGVTATPSTADLGIGATVAINVATGAPVTITGGVPTLTLNDGGTATFNAASSTATNLVFTTTIAAGQNTSDLAVTGVSLNGATVSSSNGVPVDLSGAVANPAGTLQIDTTAPTMTGVATTPGSGAVHAGQSVAFVLTPSEAVAVTGGTPMLALNDGGVATYDAASSTPTSLVFRHTVQPGQTSADLAVTAINMNGATVADGAGNLADLSAAVANPAGVLVVDTTAPTVGAPITTPGSGAIHAGQSVVFELTPSEAVTVAGGTPTLSLNDGGVATYDAASSTATSLVFRHTVQTGQNSADLAVTAVNLNGGSVTDAADNAADLSGAIGNPVGVLQVDTTAPTISALTTTPGFGAVHTGQTVTFVLTPSEPVTVTGGTPTLALSDGGVATFDAANSTSTALVFQHTVQPGQNSADLAVSGVDLNGATVTDAAGNAADLSAAAANPAGILVVDTVAPTVTGVITTPGSGTVGAGQLVTFNVTVSEPVTVSGGTPALTLNDGGTATYDPLASTPTDLVFTTTVLNGENTGDLAVIGATPNGATVTDVAGNAVDLLGAIGNPAGVLTVTTTGGVPPTVTGLTTTPGDGVLGVNQAVAITVALSSAVTVNGGTPTLTLSDGGAATFDAASSGPTELVFRHTVQAGQNSADLAVLGVDLNGATVADGSGTIADLSGAIGNPAGVLAVDTTPPSVSGVVTNPGAGLLGVGGVVTFTLSESEPVTVTGGTPTLLLSDGGVATYDPAASNGTSLVFSHTVTAGQNTADLAVTGVALNGATVADAAGNAGTLAEAVGNPAGILAVDTSPPSVAGVVTNPGSGLLGVGGVVTFTLSETEPVTVTGGTPTLLLSDGGVATYDPAASSGTSLVFSHTVTAGQNTADLAVTGVALNGATVADAAGNADPLSGAVGNPAGVLTVDTTPPAVIGVTTSPGSGTLGVNGIAAFVVSQSEPVTVAGGAPTLQLNDGGVATYDPAASTGSSLVFMHTVQAGENSADLQVTGVALNGAIVTDAAGNADPLNGAIGNPAGVLAVDTTAPTVTGVSTNPGLGTVVSGQNVTVAVAMSEAVAVAAGTPTLMLSDGGTATFDPGNSTPTTLVFVHTVQPGQNSADLAVLGVNLNGASVTDAGGNAADLSGVVGNPAGTLVVDSTSAQVTAVTTRPGTGSVKQGQIVVLAVSTDRPVSLVGGLPTLSLNDGGVAVFDPTDSMATELLFTYQVAAGENTPDLQVTGVSLNGATATGVGGAPVDLSRAVGNPAGVLQVDTTAPSVTGVSTQPGSGTLASGQPLVIDVDTSEPVAVTGGTPTLLLNNGGTATFDPGTSGSGRLAFTYTPAAGQDTGDLSITGVDLHGATVGDAAGNLLDLSRAVGDLGTIGVTTTTIAPMSNVVPVYRFFDTSTGTHFLTSNPNERNALVTPGAPGYRPDLVEEKNDFGAISPTASDPAAIEVYRFFDASYGTHFFTASLAEANGLRDPNSPTYRPDLIYEPGGTFFEHATPQAGDIPVYRLFDSTFGTHFYTANKTEFAALTTPGSGSYRSDLIAEGIEFYAPSNNG